MNIAIGWDMEVFYLQWLLSSDDLGHVSGTFLLRTHSLIVLWMYWMPPVSYKSLRMHNYIEATVDLIVLNLLKYEKKRGWEDSDWKGITPSDVCQEFDTSLVSVGRNIWMVHMFAQCGVLRCVRSPWCYSSNSLLRVQNSSKDAILLLELRYHTCGDYLFPFSESFFIPR